MRSLHTHTWPAWQQSGGFLLLLRETVCQRSDWSSLPAVTAVLYRKLSLTAVKALLLFLLLLHRLGPDTPALMLLSFLSSLPPGATVIKPESRRRNQQKDVSFPHIVVAREASELLLMGVHPRCPQLPTFSHLHHRRGDGREGGSYGLIAAGSSCRRGDWVKRRLKPSRAASKLWVTLGEICFGPPAELNMFNLRRGGAP